MSFKHFGLRAELLRSVAASGYTTPTPIQKQSIPIILSGRDILAGAQTGTGKTAAFTLPLLQILAQEKSGRKTPRALILSPTRELAAQIGDSIKAYSRYLKTRSSVIYGGVNIKPQIDVLKKGVDILVATPGRLIDHSDRGTVDLSAIEILVLDEADRMLDMGFIHDIRRIMKRLPEKRQNLMFSATYSPEIRKLAGSILTDPKHVQIAQKNMAANSVSHKIHKVTRDKKRALLTDLLRENEWGQVLVFTRTKRGANKLTRQLLSDGVSSVAIHGDKSQSLRTRALREFKNGSVKTLVATDIAARGLDIAQLPCVINYDLPHVPEDYVHRIGRTGRAGAEGIALSLVCPEEAKQLKGIQKLLNKSIPVESARQLRTISASPKKKGADTKPKKGSTHRKPKPVSGRNKKSVSLPGEWFTQR